MQASPSRPLVSVIIPTFNRASILPETIDSVVAQTYPEIEIIVVDDGSTDATAAVVAGYGPKVRYIRQANQGVEMARNRGIRAAQGEYLTFLDDDDLLLPQKIARQVAVLQAQPQVGLVHCGYHYIDREGNRLETTGQLPEGDVRRDLAWGCFPWSGGPLIRRRCLELIDEHEHRDWFGDWGMWLRVALAGFPFACVQEPLGCYRIVQGSMTDDKVANCERLVFHILEAVFTRWQLPNEIIAERDQIYAGWHFWLACRYYSGGYWAEAQRNLSAALQLRPELLRKPEQLLNLFYWDAVSPRGRVNDPIRFISQVFEHLPAVAAPFAAYRAQLLAKIYLAHAFADYAGGRRRSVPQRVITAARYYPAVLTNRGVIAILARSLPAMLTKAG